MANVAAGNWVRKVRRFVQPPSQAKCELCGATIGDEHTHMVDVVDRRLLCTCSTCSGRGMIGERYRRPPATVRQLTDMHLSDAEWDALQIPIGLAFVFYSTASAQPVALYPGPAGATESLLGADRWAEVLQRNPALARLEPDVEALLINRTNGRCDYYLVPIDRCYVLVGLLRQHWRGLSGGSQAWAAIGRFFEQLRQTGGGANWAHG
jgi:hypothetical protein